MNLLMFDAGPFGQPAPQGLPPRRKGIGGAPLWWLVLMFLVASAEAGWFALVLGEYGKPLLIAMNDAPPASLLSGSGVKAVALLSLHGIALLAWTITAAVCGEELRKRVSGERDEERWGGG